MTCVHQKEHEEKINTLPRMLGVSLVLLPMADSFAFYNCFIITEIECGKEREKKQKYERKSDRKKENMRGGRKKRKKRGKYRIK